ncbi:MAG: nucleotidyltransferase family protein [Clostridia bacterium]|nr:nucleotidyltransferase family protein [Clostridia bacterium]
MKQTIAIICEYNPFHNGHGAQLSRLRADFPEAVLLCIMSGNFTQRGEPALLPAFDRARAAVLGGADLVVELPQPWASGSAEFFAAGGVHIAAGLRADRLAFGCESEDLCAPMRVAERIDSPEFAKLLAQPEHPGEGEAARIARLWREQYGEDTEMLSKPNNMLAVQYCLAIRRNGPTLLPHPMRREGSDYADDTLSHRNPSATAIRAALRRGEDVDALADFMPAASCSVLHEAIAAGRAPIFHDVLEQAILSHYRLADPESLTECASMRGGVNYRLCTAATESRSLDEMLARAATKVYTNGRIRRAVLQGLLRVKEADLRAMPTYVRLLAASSRGRAYLAELRKQETLPVVTKISDIPSVGTERQRELSERADALYALAMKETCIGADFINKVPYFADR